MIRLAISLIIIVFFVVVFGRIYQNLKRRYPSKPIIKNVYILTIVMVILSLYVLVSGIRFTPISASRANLFIEKEAVLLEEVQVGNKYLHIYYNPKEDKYHTSETDRVWGAFYASRVTINYNPFPNEMIRTIGGKEVISDEGIELILCIEVEDLKISELGIINQQEEIVLVERVIIGEPIILKYQLPKNDRSHEYRAVALDENGQIIYYYGYKIGDTHLRDDEYKWHVMESGQ